MVGEMRLEIIPKADFVCFQREYSSRYSKDLAVNLDLPALSQLATGAINEKATAPEYISQDEYSSLTIKPKINRISSG